MTETAHERLEGTSSLLLSVTHAAALIEEHRDVLNERDRLKTLAEQSTRNEQQQLARLRDLEADRDRLERILGYEREQTSTLSRRLEHERERRAIGAGVKWQTLIERLREQGVTFDRTDEAVDAIMQRVVAGEHAMGVSADPTPVVDAVASPSFATQAAELIAKGVQPVDAVEDVMEPAEALREARMANEPVDVARFPVGSRVRLERAEGYGFREFSGCYGDVVALHPNYSQLRMVRWTGDDRPRPTNVTRLSLVELPGEVAEPEEPTA